MLERVVINRRGVRDLLRSPEIAADLRRRAEAIATAAGPGHRVEVEVGRNRVRAAVVTESFEAMWAEATRRALSAALGAGKG